MTEIADRAAGWSRRRIEEALSTERFDYQKVPLPHGLSTAGHDRLPTAKLIFPDDLSGKSVLDVGASLGFFCFEAERRGASDVRGVDVDPESVRKARLLADMQGSSATFVQADLDAASFDRRFDLVLCLNVLHHVHDPINVLNRLIDLTGETLVLEVATFGAHDKRKVRLPALVCRWLARLPIVFVTATGTRGDREIQRFYLSEAALRNLLVVHRGVFAALEVKKSPHKDRFVVLAHKRRIDRLLIVSGPTSAGKKTVEKLLLGNALPELAKLLGTPDARVWAPVLNANHIDQPDRPHRTHVLLHYDIMRPFMRSTRVYERDEALELIACAKEVTFLTVLATPERLRRQITAAEIERRRLWARKPKGRHLRVRDFYGDPDKVARVYRAWIDFAARHSDRHWLVQSQATGGYRVLPAAEWASGEPTRSEARA